jgi:arsenite methyltransferase
MQEQAIKEKVKEKIVLTENSESCCAPTECCAVISAVQMAKNIGCEAEELETVHASSILGVGCGAPVNFAGIREGEVVVDIDSGGEFDVFCQRTNPEKWCSCIDGALTEEGRS